MESTLLQKIRNNFSHILFFSILALVLILVFYPVVNINFDEWDWMELEYYIKDIPPHASKFFYWLKFYLFDQYGSIYALTGIEEVFLRFSMTGHHLMNVSLRALAAISLYFLANWWSGKKSIGFIAGLFFAIAMPGIESTTWVIVFYAYVAVIQLMVTLYFWRRFHENPTVGNLKLSVAFFTLALLISHLRLYALPFIIFLGEIYYLFIHKTKNIIYPKLKSRHWQILLIVSLVLFFLTTSLHLTAPPFRMVAPVYIVKSLLNGYPPIIHSFFLFISNLLLPPQVNFINQYINTILDLSNFGKVSLTISAFGLLLFLINLVKKNFKYAYLSFLAALYPLSLFLSRNNLTWEESQLISTGIGGSIFFVLLILVNKIKKIFPRDGELAVFGIIIMLSHLILPWMAFPQPESNIQAAYSANHRYYTVPLAGLSLVWGVILAYLWNHCLIFLSPIGAKNISLKLFLKGFVSAVLISLFLFFSYNHAIVTNHALLDRANFFNKSRDKQLWEMVKPIFATLRDRRKDRVVYFEGDLSKQDKSIITDLLRHHLINELGYGKPGNKYNVTFTDNKQTIIKLFSKDPTVYQRYDIAQSFSEDDFLAFRFDKDGLKDIKEQILNDVKSQRL